MSGRVKEIKGQVFDRLTCTAFVKCEGGVAYWECLCECGNTTVRGRDWLSRNHFKSCGCYTQKGDLKDYDTHKPEYSIHQGMKQRCLSKNPKSKQYLNYSSKGVTVCERWQGEDGFTNFYKDMGPRPSKTHSIERLDNSKGYSPDNCEWAEKAIQEYNKGKLEGSYTKFKGVSRINHCESFRAYVKVDGKQIHLGNHRSQEEAALARDRFVISQKDLCKRLGRERLKSYLNLPEEFEEELCQYFDTPCSA